VPVTTELTYLWATLILALVQIFLPAAARTNEFGTKWNAGARDNTPASTKPLTGRLERAQANLYETLPIFIGAVLLTHFVGISSHLTLWGTALYFWGRVAFVPIYALGIPYIRSLIWVVSFAGLIMILVAPFV
jgi:uncharacterized MAPEG superfamily protein